MLIFSNLTCFQNQPYQTNKISFPKKLMFGNNSHGAAVYTGSNTLIFRKAIEDVGGFPTDTITEDFELGVRMNAAGYVNYSTKSPMGSGLTQQI